ncbi:MAG: hypothetical protein HMLKMBBP_03762 [Planctomycetes bacterium]|nr:hypothetical protein [Planctomycetota bacterium]
MGVPERSESRVVGPHRRDHRRSRLGFALGGGDPVEPFADLVAVERRTDDVEVSFGRRRRVARRRQLGRCLLRRALRGRESRRGVRRRRRDAGRFLLRRGDGRATGCALVGRRAARRHCRIRRRNTLAGEIGLRLRRPRRRLETVDPRTILRELREPRRGFGRLRPELRNLAFERRGAFHVALHRCDLLADPGAVRRERVAARPEIHELLPRARRPPEAVVLGLRRGEEVRVRVRRHRAPGRAVERLREPRLRRQVRRARHGALRHPERTPEREVRRLRQERRRALVRFAAGEALRRRAAHRELGDGPLVPSLPEHERRRPAVDLRLRLRALVAVHGLRCEHAPALRAVEFLDQEVERLDERRLPRLVRADDHGDAPLGEHDLAVRDAAPVAEADPTQPHDASAFRASRSSSPSASAATRPSAPPRATSSRRRSAARRAKPSEGSDDTSEASARTTRSV